MFAAWMLLGVLSISVQQAKGEFGGLYPKLPISAALSSNSICSGESRLYEEALGNVTFWAAKSRFTKLRRRLRVKYQFFSVGFFDEGCRGSAGGQYVSDRQL